MTTLLNKFKKSLNSHTSVTTGFVTKLINNENANFAIIFALASIPVLGLTGAAIDYSRVAQDKVRIQGALDSASLAGARAMATSDDAAILEVVKKYLKSNLLRQNASGSNTCTNLPGSQTIPDGTYNATDVVFDGYIEINGQKFFLDDLEKDSSDPSQDDTEGGTSDPSESTGEGKSGFLNLNYIQNASLSSSLKSKNIPSTSSQNEAVILAQAAGSSGSGPTKGGQPISNVTVSGNKVYIDGTDVTSSLKLQDGSSFASPPCVPTSGGQIGTNRILVQDNLVENTINGLVLQTNVVIDRTKKTVWVKNFNYTAPTTFLRFIGTNTISMQLNSEATQSLTNTEIALALDNTYSMAVIPAGATQTNFEAMQTAAKDFIDILMPAGGSQNSYPYIAIVPYVGAVNLGQTNVWSPWLDVNADAKHHGENFEYIRYFDKRCFPQNIQTISCPGDPSCPAPAPPPPPSPPPPPPPACTYCGQPGCTPNSQFPSGPNCPCTECGQTNCQVNATYPNCPPPPPLPPCSSCATCDGDCECPQNCPPLPPSPPIPPSPPMPPANVPCQDGVCSNQAPLDSEFTISKLNRAKHTQQNKFSITKSVHSINQYSKPSINIVSSASAAVNDPDSPGSIELGYEFTPPDCTRKWLTKVNHFDLFSSLGIAWRGCVEARAAPYDTNDTPPNNSNPDTLFVPYFAPNEDYLIYQSDTRTPKIYDNKYINFAPSELPVNIYRPTEAYSAASYEVGKPLNVGDQPMLEMELSGIYTQGWVWAFRRGPSEGLMDVNNTLPYERDPNANCPRPIVPLTRTKSTLTTAIDNLQMPAGGGTLISEGMVWAWRVLGAFHGYGGPTTNDPFPQAVTYGPDNKKIVVVMSDGRNSYNRRSLYKIGNNTYNGLTDAEVLTWNSSDYNAYGYLSRGRVNGSWSQIWLNVAEPTPGYVGPWVDNGDGTMSRVLGYNFPTGGTFQRIDPWATANVSMLDDKTLQVCNFMKSSGKDIEIYSVLFDSNNNLGNYAVLQQCATDSNHYFLAKNQTELIDAFKKIAQAIKGKLRISK